MPHVQDLWYSPGPDGQDHPTRRHGHGKRWKARYLDPDDRERSKAFARKLDAERFLTEVEHNKLAGTYRDPDAGNITLRKYAAEWLTTRSWDAGTRQVIEQRVNGHIVPGLGSVRLAHLAQRPTVISGWLAGLPVGPRYATHILGTLSAILTAAVDDGLIAQNPCRATSVRPPRQPSRKLVPWSHARVAAVRASLPPRYQAVVDVGAGLGLRQGEIFGLPIDAVDFLRRSVRVRAQIRVIGDKLVFAPPKGGRERDVPLPESVSLVLAAHLERFPAQEVTLPWLAPGGSPQTLPLVFTSSGPRRAVHRSHFNGDVWRPARAAAGVPRGRENGMHALRHYYASALLAGGVDIRAVSEYLGHHDPGFTLRVYAHLMPGADDRARKAVEAALAATLTVPPETRTV